MFTFQFLNDKIDQNTNFAKLPSAKWLFFGTTVNFSLQILKSKHLVCLSFWDISRDSRANIYLLMQKMWAIVPLLLISASFIHKFKEIAMHISVNHRHALCKSIRCVQIAKTIFCCTVHQLGLASMKKNVSANLEGWAY